MRLSLVRTLQLIVEHGPAPAAAEAGKALALDDELVAMRRIAAYARHIPIPALSDDDRDALIDAQQLAAGMRGPGRPAVGPPVNVRLPEWIVTLLDADVARGQAASRADLIREILTDWAQERADMSNATATYERHTP